MIVMLTGTVVESSASHVVLDVAGVGYELGISATTASALPEPGTSDVTVYVRMVVREGSIDLYGFSTTGERLLFDKLVGISHVGPKLALSVLSTYSAARLATVVMAGDVSEMARVPGVGKKTASRLIMELADIIAKEPALRGLVAEQGTSRQMPLSAASASTVDADVAEALISMGFTSQEAARAIEGREEAGALTVEAALSYALRRLGKRG
jgi:Holliday junction DNA helicase RuvA